MKPTLPIPMAMARIHPAHRFCFLFCFFIHAVFPPFLIFCCFLSVMFQSPSDTSGEIIHVIRILTHFLAGSIGDLCHIHAVAGSGLHDNIQRFLAGIIGNIGSDTESTVTLSRNALRSSSARAKSRPSLNSRVLRFGSIPRDS